MKRKSKMANSFDVDTVDRLDSRMRSLVDRRLRSLGPGYGLFYREPLEIVRGEGVYLYDHDGNEYLDAYNNVPSVGHCNSHVVQALTEQAGMLNTNTRYASEAVLDYAERLLDTHAPEIDKVMFACSGSEAVDLSLRIARHVTGAEGIVVSANAYHGTTTAAAEISPSLGTNVAIGRTVRAVPAPRTGEDESVGEDFARGIADAIEDLERHGIRFAGVVADSGFVSDGIIVDPAGFLAPAVELVHAAGGLWIADEVQTGFGRTGCMWGYQRHGIVPDLVPMGKPMGNGMPISGVAARSEHIDHFGRDVRYFNTFGANSVTIAAAAAVLDVIEDQHLVENADRVGAMIRREVSGLAREYPRIHSVRGAGLAIAVDFGDPSHGEPDPELAYEVVNGLRERGVLISVAGPSEASLKIRPPLPFGEADAERLLNAMRYVIERTLS